MERTSDFNEYVDRYDNWYERNRFAYLSEVSTVKQLLPNEGLGLEVGVGTGRFASVLNIAFGIDLAKKSLRIASQRAVEVVLASGECMPFKDSIFDYVLSVITLSFFQELKHFLYEIKRTLKKTGRIIIAMVDRNSFLGEAYEKRKAEGHVFFREVIAFFSPQEIINALSECDFKNFEVYQTLFNQPETLRKVQQPVKGYGKGGFVVIGARH